MGSLNFKRTGISCSYITNIKKGACSWLVYPQIASVGYWLNELFSVKRSFVRNVKIFSNVVRITLGVVVVVRNGIQNLLPGFETVT